MTQLVTTSPIRIGKTVIAVDENGLYRLNDIHDAAKAAGIAGDSQRPGNWSKTAKAQEQIEHEIAKNSSALISALPSSSNSKATIIALPYEQKHGGSTPGVWANRRLALKYAGWLSAAFEDQVYEVFEQVVDGKLAPTVQPTAPKLEFTPTQLLAELEALKILQTMEFAGINPNLIQLGRDHSQNVLLTAVGGVPLLAALDKPLVLGVVEIAKRDLGIDITADRIKVGRYVAAQMRELGLQSSITYIERIVNGEMRQILGYSDNHGIVAELIEEYLAAQ